MLPNNNCREFAKSSWRNPLKFLPQAQKLEPHCVSQLTVPPESAAQRLFEATSSVITLLSRGLTLEGEGVTRTVMTFV